MCAIPNHNLPNPDLPDTSSRRTSFVVKYSYRWLTKRIAAVPENRGCCVCEPNLEIFANPDLQAREGRPFVMDWEKYSYRGLKLSVSENRGTLRRAQTVTGEGGQTHGDLYRPDLCTASSSQLPPTPSPNSLMKVDGTPSHSLAPCLPLFFLLFFPKEKISITKKKMFPRV